MHEILVVVRGLSCPMACGILVPWPGIEPMSPALQSRLLISGPPGKSPSQPVFKVWYTAASGNGHLLVKAILETCQVLIFKYCPFKVMVLAWEFIALHHLKFWKVNCIFWFFNFACFAVLSFAFDEGHLAAISHPWSFPGGAGGKEPSCWCRRHKRHGFHPWFQKIP